MGMDVSRKDHTFARADRSAQGFKDGEGKKERRLVEPIGIEPTTS